MATKRFGPTQDAGVAVIEKEAAGTIEPASLGVTGHVGNYEKGVPGTLIQALTQEEMTAKVGGRIPESDAPAAGQDFFSLGRGAGFMNFVRVTDGSEVKATLELLSREGPVRSPVIRVDGKSGGRWAGRLQEFVDEYVAVTETTLDSGRAMLADEFKDALVTLDALPGKSFKVLSNDSAGILTFAADVTLATDISNSATPADLLYNVLLVNLDTQVAEVLVEDGTDNPTTEFKLSVFEDGVLVRLFDNLSMDPNAANYFVPSINDDGSNEYIEVTDLNQGEVTAAKRPANFFRSESRTLTALTLTTDIADHVDNSVPGAKSSIIEALGARIIRDTVTLTNTAAGAKSAGTVLINTNAFDPALQSLGTIEIINNAFDAGDLVTINGVDFEEGVDWSAGASLILSADALVAAINNSLDPLINGIVTADNAGGTSPIVTITAVAFGTSGDAITLAETDGATDNFTLSGANLAGGFAGDNVLVNGEQFFFGAGLDVEPGASVTEAALNFANAINARAGLQSLVFAANVAGLVTITAITAGVAGDAFTLTEDDGASDNFTLSGGTLTGGVAQTWSYSSSAMPFLSGIVTSGVAFAALNDFAFGLTVQGVGVLNFALADTIVIEVRPLPVNGLIGGGVFPDAADSDVVFEIISNTANSISVRTGSDMTLLASAGDPYIVTAPVGLAGGYDGLASLIDQNFIDAYNASNSPFNELFGINVGLVKLATPGVTTPAIQKAGSEYANGRNYEYRHEIPENITTEVAAFNFMNDQIGKSDMSTVVWPSFAFITNPDGAGLVSRALVGQIQGREALVAKDNDGYHKAAAGVDVTLPGIVRLPTGDRELNGEFLNPRGINRIVKKDGNFVIWGDRMFTNDTSFKFKHTRETMSHFENIFRENFDFIVFALNNDNAQERLKTTFDAFFLPEFAKGSIVGEDAQDAARVKIDSENNTPATQADGDLFAEVDVAIVETVERLIITVSKQGIFDRAA